jgi:hypothetical protein
MNGCQHAPVKFAQEAQIFGDGDTGGVQCHGFFADRNDRESLLVSNRDFISKRI